MIKPRRRILQIIFLQLLVLTALGPFTGMQGVFTALADAGLYSDLCHQPNSSENKISNHLFSSSFSFSDQQTNSDKNSTSNGTVVCQTGCTCSNQMHHIDRGANLALSLLNLGGIFTGVLFDLAKGKKTALIGMVLWTISTALSGISPGSGLCWLITTCIAGMALNTTFFAIVLHYLKVVCPPKPDGSNPDLIFWSSLTTAIRGLSVIMNIPLSLLLTVRSLTLAGAFAVYGGVVGTLGILGFLFLFDDDKEVPKAGGGAAVSSPAESQRSISDPRVICSPAAINSGSSRFASDRSLSTIDSERIRLVSEPVSPEATSPIEESPLDPLTQVLDPPATPALTGLAKVKDSFRALAKIAVLPAFIFCALHATCTTTLGYYMTTNLDSLVHYKHGSKDDVKFIEMISLFFMGGVSLTGIPMGKLCKRLGPKKGIPSIALGNILWLAGLVLCVAFGGLWTIYILFVCLFTWRIWSLAMLNNYFAVGFQEHASGAGTAFGLCNSISGAVSVVVGGTSTRSVQQDPSRMLYITLGLAGTTVLVELGMAITIWRRESIKEKQTVL